MLAWLKWGNGITPETAGKKGDHLIGDFYVLFDKHYKAECDVLTHQFMTEGLSIEERVRRVLTKEEWEKENVRGCG
jgi:arginyl-tRNA synthetase